MLQSPVHQSNLCNHSFAPAARPQIVIAGHLYVALHDFGSASRKRIKKATATVDGEPMEQNGSDLEDSDYKDEAEDDFIQADEKEPSGGPLIPRIIMLPCLSSIFCAACSASLTACISRPYLCSDEMLTSQEHPKIFVMNSLIALQGARARKMVTWMMPWVSGTMQKRSCISRGSANGSQGSTSCLQLMSCLARCAPLHMAEPGQ